MLMHAEVYGGMGVKKIGFVTGSRADYGIMRRYLKLLKNDENIKLGILVTGALLSDVYGHQVDRIYEDGFSIDVEIPVDLDSSSNQMVLHTMAQVLDKFACYFENSKYDLLMILGDRFEVMSVAIAAAVQRIPILHIHGGEATFGNYDEFIRHCITKMSLYHFTATNEYRNRVIQLGENPSNVFYLGALGAENCLYIDESNVPEVIKKLEDKKYFVVLFHPETLTNVDTVFQIDQLLLAVACFENYKFVFLGSNADTNSYIIRDRVKKFVDDHSNCFYYENLHTDAYHYLVKHGVALIGNSSSGLIEAPSLGVYTINIGARQDGRVRGNSVIDTTCELQKIKESINLVLNKSSVTEIKNPYYKKDTALGYYMQTKEILTKINDDTKNPKHFYDLRV